MFTCSLCLLADLDLLPSIGGFYGILHRASGSQAFWLPVFGAHDVVLPQDMMRHIGSFLHSSSLIQTAFPLLQIYVYQPTSLFAASSDQGCTALILTDFLQGHQH